ncbi:MAG: hypothetical protein M0Z94_02555, partial [Dehalococcoidales bacterium]|nr:hypothetical protein [Dehalococcoidales bacterium]
MMHGPGGRFHGSADTIDAKPMNTIATTKRLLGYMAPYWRRLLMVVALMVLAAIAGAAAPALIGLAIDDFIATKDGSGLT